MNDKKKKDVKRPVLVLNLSNQVAFQTQRHLLGKNTVYELTNMIKSFVSVLKDYRIEVVNEKGKQCVTDAVEGFLNGKRTKNVLVEIMAAFLLPENFIIFYETLPSQTKELLRTIAEKHYVPGQIAQEIMGKECFGRWLWSGYEVIDELASFCTSYSSFNPNLSLDFYRENHLVFSILDFYGVMLKHIYDLRNAPRFVECMSDDLQTFNGEQNALEKMPLLGMQSECGLLKVGRTGIDSKALRKLIEETPMPEFFGEGGTDWYMSNLCAFNLMGAYAVVDKQAKLSIKSDMPSGVIRQIFKTINTCPSALLVKLLLPHVSGFKVKQFDGCSTNDLIKNIYGGLSKLDEEKWMSVDYFLMSVRTQAYANTKQPEGTYKLFFEDYFYKSTLVNGFTNSIITLDKIISDLSNPFVKSFLFLLSSFGIVEIAYHAVPPANATSIYDTLQYVRITKLGKFALGIVNHYDETGNQGRQSDFTVDDERLLLKLNNPKSPYVFILEEFGKSVTPSLYRVDYNTFLKGCTTPENVEERIALFKRHFGENLPEVWTSFFKEVISRCSPLTKVGKKYILRRIDAKDKCLQNIILTDEKLKKHVLRAENYILLIEQDSWDVVVERLRAYGYVL